MIDRDRVYALIERHLMEIETLFKSHCKLTFLMRNPELEDGDLILTTDELDQVITAIQQLKENNDNTD